MAPNCPISPSRSSSTQCSSTLPSTTRLNSMLVKFNRVVGALEGHTRDLPFSVEPVISTQLLPACAWHNLPVDHDRRARMAVRVGAQIHPQHASYTQMRDTWLRVEDMGADTLYN